MNRRMLKLAAAATAVICSMALAACGSSVVTETGAVSSALNSCGYPVYTQKVTLTWWTWVPNADNLAKDFEKCYPSITINEPVVPSSSGEYAKLEAAMTAGAGAPDVVQIEYQVLPTFIGQNDLVNIASVMDKYKDDYPAWVWKEVSSGNAVYASPQDIGPMGMAYRPAVLQKYHLPVPQTWAQFASDAIALHKDDPSVYLTYFPDNDGSIILAMLWQAGAAMFKQTAKYSWQVDIDTAENQKVLQYWLNLAKAGAINVTSDYTPTWENQIADGTYASYLTAAWGPDSEINPYLKGNSQSFTMTHMPDWVAGQQSDANWGGSTDAVTIQSQHPVAAALFAAFMNTSSPGLETGQLPGTPTGGGGGLFMADVNRESVPSFNGKVPNFTGNVNAAFSQYANTVNTSFEWSPFTEFLYTELSSEVTDAFNGTTSISAALAATQSAVIKYGNASGYSVSAGAGT